MLDRQFLLLLFYMTLSTWLEFKSVKSKNPDAQVGWMAANWIIVCLYTTQFTSILKAIDFLKELDEGLLLLLSFLTLSLYTLLMHTVIKSL